MCAEIMARVATAPTEKVELADGRERLVGLERSFLDYTARTLAFACDPDLPLLERVRFCSIFSQMLDEFFTARFAGSKRLPHARGVRTRVRELQSEQSELWTSELRP